MSLSYFPISLQISRLCHLRAVTKSGRITGTLKLTNDEVTVKTIQDGDWSGIGGPQNVSFVFERNLFDISLNVICTLIFVIRGLLQKKVHFETYLLVAVGTLLIQFINKCTYTEAKVDVTQEIEQRAQLSAPAWAACCALCSISCVTCTLASVNR